MQNHMALNSIEDIIEDIRQGKMVILMDDEDRENEGDLVMAAEHCTLTDQVTLFDTDRVFLIIGTILGLIVASASFFRAARKANREAMNQFNERKNQP